VRKESILKLYSSTSFWTFALSGIKLLVVAGLLVAAPNAWANMFFARFDTFMTKGHLVHAMGYAIIFWTSILAFGLVPFLCNAYVRIALVIVIIISYAADKMYLDFTGFHFQLASLWVVWFERGVGLTSLPFFASYFVRNYWWIVGAGIVMALPPAHNWSLRLRWSSVPLSALALVSSVILYTKAGTQEFPPTFAFPVMFEMAATTNSSMGSIGPAEVEYDYPIKPLARHIVVIIDESVRGDLMEINEPKVRNTPFLVQQKDRVINFGVAVAPSNCSFLSRTILRFGLRPEDFVNSGLSRAKRPPIWKYAHKAGFRTIMIEAWGGGKNFYSLEWPFIDMYLPVTSAPPYMRDAWVAERLVQLLKEDEPSLIYVNKFGTHFPYESSYPPEFDNLRLPPERRTLANWRGGSYHPNDTRDELLHSYDKAILWSVDGFFQRFLDLFEDNKVLLLYTSDHGQSLLDGGQRKSHCTTPSENTQLGEGLVPLIVSTGIGELNVRLREGAARVYNRASGFDIFPTLLLAMGYNEEWVRTWSGPSLLDVSPNRKRRFLRNDSPIDLFGKPNWFPVD